MEEWIILKFSSEGIISELLRLSRKLHSDIGYEDTDALDR